MPRPELRARQRAIEALAQLLAQDITASELLSLIRNSEVGRGSDFDFGLLSAAILRVLGLDHL
jgi:hypothetical protein